MTAPANDVGTTPTGETGMRHDQLVVLTAYMAEHNYSVRDVAYAVEKPWKHWDVYNEAVAENQVALSSE